MGERSRRFWSVLAVVTNLTSAWSWILLAAGSATKDDDKTWRARGARYEWAWWTLLALGPLLATCMQLKWVPFTVLVWPVLVAVAAFFLIAIWGVILLFTWRPPSTLSVAGYLWWTFGMSFWSVAALWRLVIRLHG